MSAPLQHGTVTVGTNAIALLTCPAGNRKALVKIRNNSGTATIYIGDTTVTSSGGTQGFAIPPNSADSFEFTSNTVVSCIASAAATSVSYIFSAGN